MSMLIRVIAVACAMLATASARADVQVQQLTSPAGHEFWLVEEMSIPIVAVEIQLANGSWADPNDKIGVSRFAIGLMDEGSGDLDAVEFSNLRRDLAARFGFGVRSDSASISARFLLETLDEGIDLLTLAMSDPRFDLDAVERSRAQILAAIARSETSPASIAGRAWFSRAFPNHPYGRPVQGTHETISAITVDDLKEAHRRLLIRTDAKVVLVGAIDGEVAGELVDKLLGVLPEGDVGTVSRAKTLPEPGLFVVSEDVPQSIALFGHAGIPWDDPDYFAAVVANRIFGSGSFGSRLTEEVRVKRGLAYSVYASNTVLDGAEIFYGRVQTENARMAESLKVIRDQWARMASGDATPEEVDAAKTYLTGSFPLSFDTNSKIAGYLVWMMGRGLDPDYINRRNEYIEAVYLDDVRRVSRRLYDPEALSIVVVGQPEGLEPID
ncbi:MAG: pitrilysin family protein [Pseudomonadota bacterium]